MSRLAGGRTGRSRAAGAIVALAAAALAACADSEPDAVGPPPDAAAPPLAPVTERALATLADAGGFPVAPEGLDNIPPGDPPPTDEDARAAFRGLSQYASGIAGRDRELALADLVGLGARMVVPAYEVALDRELAPAQRLVAVDALAQLDTEAAIEALFRVQRDSTDLATVRARAAWRLGELGREETIPQLTLRLKYEIDPETIVWLTWALGRMGSLAGYAGVVEMLEAWELPEGLRATIAQHAVEVGAPFGADSPQALLELWREPPADFAWTARGPAYERSVWLWIERLEEYDLRVIDEARFLLPRLDRRAADLLAEALRDEGLYRRIHAAQCIGRMDGRARHRVPDVTSALNRPDTAERALEALAGIGGDEARRAIEDRLLPHRPPAIRVTAAYALGTLGDQAAIDALEAAWPEPNSPGAREVEQAIAVALAKLGRVDAMIPRLAADLIDPALSPIPSREGIVAWLEAHAPDDPWAAQKLESMPPIGQDATPLDAFWAGLAADPAFAERVANAGR